MKEDRNKKHKIIAILVSILVHAALIVALFFIFLPSIEHEEEGGILVNIGDTELASGMFTPHQLDPDYEPATPPTPQERIEDEFLTQEDSEAPAIKQEEKKKEQKKKDEAEALLRQKEIEKEQRIQKELEEQRRKEKIRKSVAGAFGNAEKKSGTGETPNAEPGVQGSPDGNVSSGGVNTGVGGFGGSFSLKGRKLVGNALPRPSYDTQIEGTIVLEIIVSPEGKVLEANPTVGTNIDNYQMKNSAIKAAKRAKFTPIDGLNNQIGTITYRYVLN